MERAKGKYESHMNGSFNNIIIVLKYYTIRGNANDKESRGKRGQTNTE